MSFVLVESDLVCRSLLPVEDVHCPPVSEQMKDQLSGDVNTPLPFSLLCR